MRMSEWDEFYEEDLKDEFYEPLHWQICKDKDCKFCKQLREGDDE